VNPSTGGLSEAEAAARKHLAKELETKDIEVTGREIAVIPDTGEQLLRLTAAAPGEANTPRHVVVDSRGKVRDLEELETSAGRRLFVPDIGPVGPPIELPARVTIDPSVNDLVLERCRRESERLTVTIPESGATPKADVYLLADTTGSMSPVIEAVKAGIGAIVGNPALAGFDVAYGVGNYKDFPHDPYAFQHQLSPTTDTLLVSSAIAAWSAGGGRDGPEGQLYALHRLATDPAVGWRPDARRIIVWFGDAPGHDPVCAAITGEPADITEASATAELQAAPAVVVAVSTTTNFMAALDDDPTAGAGDYGVCGAPGGIAGQATRIAAATGGSHTTGIDAGAIVTTLVSLIQAAVTSTGNVRLVPSAEIAEFIESLTPPAGYGPLPGNVEQVLPFDVVWVGTRKCREEDQVVNGTIDVVADGVVVAQKSARITVPACRFHHAVEVLCGTRPPEEAGRCETVVPGRYATAVTIYNPSSCPVEIEKRFAPLVRRGEAEGREPRMVPARPFARIELRPGEATMDDCCALEEAVGPTGGPITLGVLDIIANRPLEVVAVMSSSDEAGTAGAAVHTRHVEPKPY
jgi:hypothetical protein